MNPGISGTTVINNIFDNNIVALGLSNSGASQCLIRFNLFNADNLPGGASGTAIYTDQFVSGAVSNVLIDENSFTNNQNAGVGFSSTDTTKPDSNITITNNLFDNCGRGIYFFNTQSSVVTGNIIENVTVPTDGGSSVGIGIFGGDSDLTISDNNIQNGAKYGIFIIDALTPNQNITLSENNITGFPTAALFVADAPSGPVDYAVCNWWGSPTGPTNPMNPGGTGGIVSGDVVLANFDPWLLSPAPNAQCATPVAPTVSKSFVPSTVFFGERSLLTITFNNPNPVAITFTAPFVDNLPNHMRVDRNASTTCSGVLTAPNGSTTITLSGTTIPANSSCTITAEVLTTKVGGFTNDIPIGALQTDIGSNTVAAEAILFVVPKPRNRGTGGGSINAVYDFDPVPIPIAVPVLPPIGPGIPLIAPAVVPSFPLGVNEAPKLEAPMAVASDVGSDVAEGQNIKEKQGCTTVDGTHPFAIALVLLALRAFRRSKGER